jgi:hypothetical protein
MPTREIARTEWKTYFDEFSRTRAGELVTVELIYSPQADPQYALTRQPLAGMTFEEKGGEPGTIEISAGTEENNSLTHTITNPVHVYHKNARGLLSDEVNVDEVIEITSTDDPRIVFLRFTPAS